MLDAKPEFPHDRGRSGGFRTALVEGLVALAQGGLALVLGVLARALSGGVDAARNVGGMTSMSWLGPRPIASVTSHMSSLSPVRLAIVGLGLVLARGLAATWLAGAEVRAA